MSQFFSFFSTLLKSLFYFLTFMNIGWLYFSPVEAKNLNHLYCEEFHDFLGVLMKTFIGGFWRL